MDWLCLRVEDVMIQEQDFIKRRATCEIDVHAYPLTEPIIKMLFSTNN